MKSFELDGYDVSHIKLAGRPVLMQLVRQQSVKHITY